MGTGDAHKNLSSESEFHENMHSEGHIFLIFFTFVFSIGL
jgi:hypothetical protein